MATHDLRSRVRRAAEDALADQEYVRPVDVLVGVGWLAATNVEAWRRGRIDHLEQLLPVERDKIMKAMSELRRWAWDQGLQPIQTDYPARDGGTLRFTTDGDQDVESTLRTHWLSPDVPERKRQRIVEKQSRPPDLVVVQSTRDWTCAGCGNEFFSGNWLKMEDGGPHCLECADLDHLEYLPAGNATLTRRAKKASRLSAVVVRWSRARKRYERQGLLVEADALERAEASCLADADLRERRRFREADWREATDEQFVADLARAIRAPFPGCPPERAARIAGRAGERGSGRIGRTAAGRALDPDAVRMATIAAIRHEDTDYDELLMSGVPREDARARVRDDVERVLAAWRVDS